MKVVSAAVGTMIVLAAAGAVSAGLTLLFEWMLTAAIHLVGPLGIACGCFMVVMGSALYMRATQPADEEQQLHASQSQTSR